MDSQPRVVAGCSRGPGVWHPRLPDAPGTVAWLRAQTKAAAAGRATLPVAPPDHAATGVAHRCYIDQLRLSYRLKPGVYDLSMVVRDPSGYRAPLNLAITGRTDTGRYPLGTLTVQPGPPWFDLFLPNLIS